MDEDKWVDDARSEFRVVWVQSSETVSPGHVKWWLMFRVLSCSRKLLAGA